MKYSNLLMAGGLLGLVAGDQSLSPDRQTFEDFIEMYGNEPKYTPEEQASQERLVTFLITVLDLKHIETYTPNKSHANSELARGNNDSQVTRHGRVVELQLDGRGWDVAYEKFYLQETPYSNWNLGFKAEVNTEFDLSWKFPVYINKHHDVTLFEVAPLLHMELNAWASLEFHIWFMNIRLVTHAKPYTFTPFDVSVKMDPIKPQRWCHGADYYGEALYLDMTYEQDVNECHWGLFGQFFTPDNLDCTWRYYKPETPLFSTQITQKGDFFGHYYPYRCMNWHQADWEEWPLSQTTINAARREREEKQKTTNQTRSGQDEQSIPSGDQIDQF